MSRWPVQPRSPDNVVIRGLGKAVLRLSWQPEPSEAATTLTMMRRIRQRRTRVRLLAFLSTVVTIVAAWSFLQFVVPSENLPESADAVVVFAGGQPNERIGRALDLMEQGVAPRLIVSEGNQVWARGTELERLCSAGSDSFEVVCATPDPDSTIGEATMFADFAAEHGWDSLVIVTSNYHLTRASLWLRRCSPAELFRVGTGERGWPNIPHEILGTIHAKTLNRECPSPGEELD